MEKSYALNRLVADFGECSGLSTTDIKPLCKMAVLNSMRANMLSHSLYESFGIALLPRAFNKNYMQQISKNFTYKTSPSWQ